VVIFLSLVSADISGKESAQLIMTLNQDTIDLWVRTLSDSGVPATEIFQKNGFVKGRITQSATDTPVGFADIFNRNKTSSIKSNSKGEFILGPLEFPAALTIKIFSTGLQQDILKRK
jgi:hypothetical protein